MAIFVQLRDPEELFITMQTSDGYNPDVLEDLKRRMLDAYKEALAFRHAMFEQQQAGVSDE